MNCLFCGATIEEKLQENHPDENELRIAAFRSQGVTALLFVPLKDGTCKLYHSSKETIKEEVLARDYIHIMMVDGDSLLIVQMQAGFPTLHLSCENGLIRTGGGTYLNVVVGDIETMSK